MYYYHSERDQSGRNQDKGKNKREIQVDGEGRLTVSPDIAKINLGVETEGRELEQAQATNAGTIANIVQGLVNMGVAEENIQTINFTIFPIYDFEDGKQAFRGYRVEHMLLVTVLDINQVGALVDSAVRNGANRVANVSFDFLNPSIAYREALKLAVEDAISKAKTIAHTLQIPLVETPWKVVEGNVGSSPPIPFAQSAMVKSASTEMAPGQQDVMAFVTAFFHTT